MLNMYKTLIIKSIGTANPGIAKILADAFKINHEFLVKQLYNAPSVFLENTEKEIADKAAELLEQLGLEVFLQDANMPLPVKAEPVDIAIFIKNPLEINQVSKQLAIFLGCKENEALSLLLNEPSVVLGNVSMATAETLQKRIDAEVIASNPRKDFYTIQFLNGDKKLPQEIQALLKTKGIQAKSEKTITNIPYLVAQEIWQRYQLSKKIIFYNQSYQRFESVYEGKTFYDAEVAKLILNNFKPTLEVENEEIKLSEREIEIIILIAKNASTLEIAEKLFLSPHPAKTNRKNINFKLGIHNPAELIQFARQRNLIS